MSAAQRTVPAARLRGELPLVLALVAVQAAAVVITDWFERPAAAGVLGLAVAMVDLVSSLSFAIVGAVIVIRRPRSTIGWLFAVANLGWLVGNAATAYARSSIAVSALPWTPLAAWLATWPGPLSLGAYYLIILLFPNGEALSTRWRRFTWLAAGFSATHALMMAVGAGPVGSLQFDGISVANPLGLGGPLGRALGDLANGPMQLGTLAMIAASAVSMVLRLRRSRGIERAQLKWLTWAVVVTVALWISDLPVMMAYESLLDAPSWVQAWNAISTSSGVIIPVAAGVAILRYHLYDIDRIVSRTVAWGTVTLVLVVVFAGAVVGLDDLLAGVTQGQTLAVAASTLAAFALFQPLRRWVQAAVDRRFDRARYDARRIVDTFAEGLRGQVNLVEISDGMLAAVAGTVRPRTESVWLRGQRR